MDNFKNEEKPTKLKVGSLKKINKIDKISKKKKDRAVTLLKSGLIFLQ